MNQKYSIGTNLKVKLIVSHEINFSSQNHLNKVENEPNFSLITLLSNFYQKKITKIC